VLFHPHVAEKLVKKHRVTEEEVRQAVLFSSYRDCRVARGDLTPGLPQIPA
jgi:hypothetical protein